MEGMGKEKLYFLLLKSVKWKKVQLRVKCLNSLIVAKELSEIQTDQLIDWEID